MTKSRTGVVRDKDILMLTGNYPCPGCGGAL